MFLSYIRVLVPPLASSAVLVGRKVGPVSASILLSHVLRLRLQLEAHSSASGWPGLRADAHACCASQVLQNGLVCSPVPPGVPREHVGSVDNVVSQPL